MRHRLLLAASLVLAAPLGVPLAAQVQVEVDSTTIPRRVAGLLVGADVELHVLATSRGTPAPIHLNVQRSQSARRGAPATGPLPTTLRAEFAAARTFGDSAASMVAREAGPVAGDSMVATLVGTAARLSLARLPDADGKGAYRLHVVTPAGIVTAFPDAAEATAIANLLRDLGVRLDPEGRADDARLYDHPAQVDVPVLSRRGSCPPTYPPQLLRAGIEGRVVAQFVVTSAGLVDPASFKVLRSSHDGLEAAVRQALTCMRYQPAMLRGRPVKMRTVQPFTFKLES